jgi:hypothetical protein
MKWAALVTWVITAGGGFVLLAIWLKRGGMQQGAAGGSRTAAPDVPTEQHFPVAVVGLHGLLAATTLVLVLLAAAGVGGS